MKKAYVVTLQWSQTDQETIVYRTTMTKDALERYLRERCNARYINIYEYEFKEVHNEA